MQKKWRKKTKRRKTGKDEEDEKQELCVAGRWMKSDYGARVELLTGEHGVLVKCPSQYHSVHHKSHWNARPSTIQSTTNLTEMPVPVPISPPQISLKCPFQYQSVHHKSHWNARPSTTRSTTNPTELASATAPPNQKTVEGHVDKWQTLYVGRRSFCQKAARIGPLILLIWLVSM